MELLAPFDVQLIPPWEPPTKLSPQLNETYIKRFLYRLSTHKVADILVLKPETIEKYVSRIYNTLSHPNNGNVDLAGIDPEKLT